MNPVIPVTHLLEPLHQHLMTLLQSLSADDWQRPTICPLWTVKDIAAHLFDTSVRRLSMHRDGFQPFGEGAAPEAGEELLVFLNRLNAEWVRSMRRVSPAVLLEMIDRYGREQNRFLLSLDPEGPALWPVAWAGEQQSRNWFDVAREYTERWLHQQQIREAVGAPPEITTREFLHPVLEIFMRGVPQALSGMQRPEGTQLRLVIEGPAGGTWHLRQGADCWAVTSERIGLPAAETRLPQDLAWRLFSRAVRPETVFHQVSVTGDLELARRALGTVSVMA